MLTQPKKTLTSWRGWLLLTTTRFARVPENYVTLFRRVSSFLSLSLSLSFCSSTQYSRALPCVCVPLRCSFSLPPLFSLSLSSSLRRRRSLSENRAPVRAIFPAISRPRRVAGPKFRRPTIAAPGG